MSVINPERARSVEAVDRLFRRHRVWLLDFLTRRFGRLVGEDAAQEAFARTLASGADVRNPRAFLAKVAIRAALEEIRQRPELGFTYEAVAAVQPDAEQAVLLEQLVHALPEPIRDVFLLSRFGGLSNVEIAQRCNLSVKRVEARLTEARRRCAALIQD
jgi:RNA polymerase sigma factor (sigma-70 family)